jgi:hypothetical protein
VASQEHPRRASLAVVANGLAAKPVNVTITAAG